MRWKIDDDDLIYYRDEPTQEETDEYYKIEERQNEQRRLQDLENKEVAQSEVRVFDKVIVLEDGTEITEVISLVPKLIGHFNTRLDVFKEGDQFDFYDVNRARKYPLMSPHFSQLIEDLPTMLTTGIELFVTDKKTSKKTRIYLKAKVDDGVLSFYRDKR